MGLTVLLAGSCLSWLGCAHRSRWFPYSPAPQKSEKLYDQVYACMKKLDRTKAGSKLFRIYDATRMGLLGSMRDPLATTKRRTSVLLGVLGASRVRALIRPCAGLLEANRSDATAITQDLRAYLKKVYNYYSYYVFGADLEGKLQYLQEFRSRHRRERLTYAVLVLWASIGAR